MGGFYPPSKTLLAFYAGNFAVKGHVLQQNTALERWQWASLAGAHQRTPSLVGEEPLPEDPRSCSQQSSCRAKRTSRVPGSAPSQLEEGTGGQPVGAETLERGLFPWSPVTTPVPRAGQAVCRPSPKGCGSGKLIRDRKKHGKKSEGVTARPQLAGGESGLGEYTPPPASSLFQSRALPPVNKIRPSPT